MTEDGKTLAALAEVLRVHFHEVRHAPNYLNEAKNMLEAARLVNGAHHHAGARDIDSIRRIRAALREIERAPLSGWAADNIFGIRLQQLRNNGFEFEDIAETGDPAVLFLDAMSESVSKSEMFKSLDSCLEFIEEYVTCDKSGKEITTNYRVFYLIEHCRHRWAHLTLRMPPSRGLALGTKFARYLCDVFDVLDIKADPQAAFRGWARWAEKTGRKDATAHDVDIRRRIFGMCDQ